jgi:hypothetical protein
MDKKKINLWHFRFLLQIDLWPLPPLQGRYVNNYHKKKLPKKKKGKKERS